MKQIYIIFMICVICSFPCYGLGKIDFSKLNSPIIFHGNHKYAYRDPAVVFHNRRFYLYFTLSENASDGGYYNLTAYSISDDLIHWTFPEIMTPRDRNLNYISPGTTHPWGGKFGNRLE